MRSAPDGRNGIGFTTRQDRRAVASPNLLQQCFQVERINHVWLTDITYIDTDEGWLFLTAVLDLASRRSWDGRCRPRWSNSAHYRHCARHWADGNRRTH